MNSPHPQIDPAILQLAQGLAQRFPGMSASDQMVMATALTRNEPYALGPDSQPQDGVPRGQLTQYRCAENRIYPGTARDWWLYVPAQCDGLTPANLMVFLDGARYLGPETNVPVAFDNLIHLGQLPPTVVLFINPGDKGPGIPLWGGTDNRSMEFDRLGDTFAHFLIEEMLPQVVAQQPLEAGGHAICGLSSGGLAAFNVAWERPDVFDKVLTHCGSFVNIRGGHEMASIVRRSEPKPIRVFLQAGHHDLDVVFGHWKNANQEMAAALNYHGYDHQLVIGEGGHSLKHGGAILPESLRWLWRP